MNNAPVRGVVLGHGDLPAGLVDAARQITGSPDDALLGLSNKALSPETLANRIEELLGGGPAIVFTDLQGGSCAFAARRLTRDHPHMVVISGVNLPLLLDFLTHRHLPLAELTERLVAKGRAEISCTPPSGEGYAHSAVSGG